MIEPHLATMFCFVATDAVVARGVLDGVIRRGGRSLVQPGDRRLRPVHQRHGGRPGQRPRRERAARAGGRGLRQFARGLEAADGAAGADAGRRRRGRAPSSSRWRCAGRPAGATRSSPPAAWPTRRWSRRPSTAHDPNWGRIMMALGKSAARDRPGQGRDHLRGRAPWSSGACSGKACAWSGSARSWSGPEYEITIDLGLGPGEDARRDLAISARSTCGSTRKYTT